ERGGLGRHVVHPPVGDEDDAGDAVMGNVGERRRQRREQPRAVGLAVGLAGLDEAHLHAGHAPEPFGQRRARRLGLLGAVAEFLTRALVDDHDRDRGQRIAVFARERRIGEREHEQRERDGAYQRTAGADKYQQQRKRERNGRRHPHDVGGDQRRERNTEIQLFFFLFLRCRSRAGGDPYSRGRGFFGPPFAGTTTHFFFFPPLPGAPAPGPSSPF